MPYDVSAAQPVERASSASDGRGRQPKPRFSGLTIVIDKGMDLVTTEHWLSLTADYVDFIKLGFGTAPYIPQNSCKKDLFSQVLRRRCLPGRHPAGGGCSSSKAEEFLSLVKELGFTYVESLLER